MSTGSKPALQSYYPKSVDMQASSIFPISLELQKRQDSSMMRALAMQGYHRPSMMGPPPHHYEKYSTSMMPEDFMRMSIASGKKEVGKLSVSKLPSSSDHSQRKSTPSMHGIDIQSNQHYFSHERGGSHVKSSSQVSKPSAQKPAMMKLEHTFDERYHK